MAKPSNTGMHDSRSAPSSLRVRRWRNLVIVQGVLLPFAVIILLVVMNPFGWAFITAFEVTNHTPEPLWVTPVGTARYDGRRGLLPMMTGPIPSMPTFRAGRYRIEPGKTITLHYDMDDIYLSELVIEDRLGNGRVMVLHSERTSELYREPLHNTFDIRDVTTLAPASQEFIAMADAAGGVSSMPFLVLVSLVVCATFTPVLRAYRKVRSAASGHPSPASTSAIAR
jgi:hypothetical protein